MRVNQANLLKVAAVAIAIPRYAGAFALSAGFVAQGQLHSYLGIAEVVAGVSMAVLEGFALAFILSKWRLLKVGSVSWYALLAVISLLALSLPLVAIPYLYFAQESLTTISSIFPNVWVQNGWNFIIAGVPMLIVVGVGLADVNELEREQKQANFELELNKERARVEVELSKLELEVEQAKVLNQLKVSELRARHKVDLSNLSAKTKQSISKGFACEYCGDTFEKQQQLNGHLAHCKARQNGKPGSDSDRQAQPEVTP